ncbi:MAG: hypothetical protein HY554_01270, partial [Elusimicrobia bacterium]|nr:hypothetical protein [Elusimicrobiota bacterium]
GRVLPHERYSNVSGGADVAVTLSPRGEDGVRRIGGAGRGAAPTGKGVARVDFGGGALATQHKQEAAAAGLGAPSLTQTNAHAFVGASVLNILASARLARNFYDKDLKTAALPASRYQAVAGNMTYEGNYPQNNLLLSVELGALPMVRPFASFAHTTYMDLGAAGQPGDTRAYTAGVRVGLEMVAVEAAIQRLSVNGAKDHTFTTLGASLRL